MPAQKHSTRRAEVETVLEEAVRELAAHENPPPWERKEAGWRSAAMADQAGLGAASCDSQATAALAAAAPPLPPHEAQGSAFEQAPREVEESARELAGLVSPPPSPWNEAPERQLEEFVRKAAER